MAVRNNRSRTTHRPPAFARWLLRRLIRGKQAEFVLGDIEEGFQRHHDRDGVSSSRRWYWRQALASIARCARASLLSSLRPLAQRLSSALRESFSDSWFQDIRFGTRSLLRRPGFTAVALATLGLGIGANTAIFSVVHGILLKPLDFPQPEELVAFWSVEDPEGTQRNLSGPNVHDLMSHSDSFDGIYAYTRNEHVIANREGLRLRVQGVSTSHNVFEVLAAAPQLGRGFVPEEEGAGAPRVLVISHSLWQSHYGGDPAILDRSIDVDGEQHRVVGVTRPGFRLPMSPESHLFIPFDQNIEESPRDVVWLGAVGRLADGVTLARAREQVDRLWLGLREQFPAETVNVSLAVFELRRDLTRSVRPALLMLLAATGFLLLMACANVANLLLARSSSRRAEMSIRSSLGAGRSRLIRQLLTENAVLTGGATLLGVGLAVVARTVLLDLAPVDLPRADEVKFDMPVLAFASLLACSTTFLSGLLPALRSSDRGAGSLRDGAARSIGEGRRGQHTRHLLMAGQVAVAAVLMIGAGLLIRSFTELIHEDPGYRIEGVLQAQVMLPRELYQQAEVRAGLFERLEAEAATLPGVTASGVTLIAPLEKDRVNYEVRVEGRPQSEPGEAPGADLGIASAGYFETLMIPLLAGRNFSPSDRHDQPDVVLISNLLQRSLWPDGDDPIGQRISLVTGDWSAEPRWREIIGVVGDVKQQSYDTPQRPYLYLPNAQSPQFSGRLLLRVQGDPAVLSGPVRELLRDVEPMAPAPVIETMEVRLAQTLADRRFYTLLLVVFATVALLLASIGIFGVLSFAVSRRTNEIGLRLTFGARHHQILGMILKEGLVVTLAGLTAGLLSATALSRFLGSLIYGISALDPVTFSTIGLVLLGVAGVACLLPAARALSIDPVRALRSN